MPHWTNRFLDTNPRPRKPNYPAATLCILIAASPFITLATLDAHHSHGNATKDATPTDRPDPPNTDRRQERHKDAP